MLTDAYADVKPVADSEPDSDTVRERIAVDVCYAQQYADCEFIPNKHGQPVTDGKLDGNADSESIPISNCEPIANR